MMDKSRRAASIAVDSPGLSFPDRQIALRQIIDELQDLRDSAVAASSDRRPALDRLLPMIRASIEAIANADDDCWKNIIRELLQLRATLLRLKPDANVTCH
jgi:soluble P-type ATPase